MCTPDLRTGNRQEYVLCFVFNPMKTAVALIKKDRPQWQAGSYNGLGGKVKEGEALAEAASREVLEESGLDIPEARWQSVGRLEGSTFVVHIFTCTCSYVFTARTVESEEVEVFSLTELPVNQVHNLSWLIPICVDTEHTYFIIYYR